MMCSRSFKQLALKNLIAFGFNSKLGAPSLQHGVISLTHRLSLFVDNEILPEEETAILCFYFILFYFMFENFSL